MSKIQRKGLKRESSRSTTGEISVESLKKQRLAANVRFAKQNKKTDEPIDDFDLQDINSDQEDFEESFNHDKLIDDITSLSKGKKAKRFELRREAQQNVSDVTLSALNQKVNLGDLLDSASDPHEDLQKFINLRKQSRVLSTPLLKTQSDSVQRQAFFQEASKKVGKWQSVVRANQDAEQLRFPLNEESVRLEGSKEVVDRYTSRNDMEKEIDELLQSSKNYLKDEKPLTEAEEKYLKAVSVEEAKARHQQLQKMRALLSYQEAKFKRQKKIKSKKYHKILKQEKLRKELKNFEQLKQDNPEAALEKLAELDKVRILERASLRHKNTGKWAKRNLLRTKNDSQVREALNEQVEIAKKATRKIEINQEQREKMFDEEEIQEDDDDGKNDQNDELPLFPDNFNPWMRTQKEALQEMIGENRDKEQNKFEEVVVMKPIDEKVLADGTFKTKQKRKTRSKVKQHRSQELQKDVPEPSVSTNEGEGKVDKSDGTPDDQVKTPVIKEKANKSQDESKDLVETAVMKEKSADNLKQNQKEIATSYFSLKDINEDASSDEDDEQDAERRALIAEAFAEDEVVADFIEEKGRTEEREKPKDICNYMPGWGDWGGPSIKDNDRKKKRMTIKAEKKERRDANLNNVVISEKKDDVISKYMVKYLPFPYTSVQQYENSMRHPIGNTWNSETAFKDLIEPPIITKMGKIIEPMNEESLPRRESYNKSDESKRKFYK